MTSMPTATIDSASVDILGASTGGTFGVTDQVEQRSTAAFSIRQRLTSAGQKPIHYQQGQQISILNPDGSQLFWGYLDVPTERMNAGASVITQSGQVIEFRTDVTCKDGIYWADKRTAAVTFSNTLAGDIVSYLVQTILAAEGVIGYHVSRTETTQADWQSINGGGALSSNLDAITYPGDLRLALNGSLATQTQTDTTQAAFAAGTLTQVQANSTPSQTIADWFIDGFESGNFTAGGWDTSGGANWAVQSTTKDTGSFAAKGTASTSGQTLKKDLGGTQAQVYVKVRWWANQTTATTIPIGLLDQGGVSAPAVVMNSDGHWAYWNGTAFTHFPTDQTYAVTTWYTVEAWLSGGTLRVWINGTELTGGGVTLKNISNGTVTGATKVQHFCANGVSATAALDNVQVRLFTSGTWVTPALAGPTTGGLTASSITWAATIPSGASLAVQTSLDGGTTWQTATSGAAIPGLVTGQSMNGVSVQVKASYTAPDPQPASTPTLTSLIFSVTTTQYATSGQRISPALDISAADIARAATVSWDATMPAGTSLVVETSLDNGVSWQSVTNGGTISGLQLEPPPYDDVFDSDSSSLYSQSGGAVWTWDTLDNLLSGSNASGSSGDGFLLYSGLTPVDVTVEADVSEADDLSLLARRTGSTTYYRLRFQGSPTPGAATMTLSKVVAGVETVLQMATIDFQPGDLHRLSLEVIGTALTGSIDQRQADNSVTTSQVTATDSSISGAGTAGFLLARPASGTNLATVEWFHVEPHGQALSGVSLLVRQTLTPDTNRDLTPTLSDLTVKISTRTIQDGPTIVQATCNYGYCSDFIAALATAATFIWNIRPDKRCIFQWRELKAAAWSVWTDANGVTPDIQYPDGSDPTVQTANPLYRNSEIILGGTSTTATQIEEQKGDGSTRAFTVTFPLAEAPSVLQVNGVAKTVGLKGVDTGKDFYWAAGDNTLAQDNSGTILTSSDVFHIEYVGSFQVVTKSQDPAAIADRQTVEGGGTGIVEMVDDGSDLTSQSAAFQRAGAILQKYGVIGRTFTFETKRAGLVSGTLLRVNIPIFDFTNALLLISQVQVYDVDTELRYQITAVEGPVIGSWTKFFANLISKIPSSVDSVSVGASGIVSIVENVAGTRSRAESVTETVFVCPIIGPTTIIGPSLIVC